MTDYEPRKVIQIAIADGPPGVVQLVCVCNDGTMWRMQETGYWTDIRNVPQPIERDPADTTIVIDPSMVSMPADPPPPPKRYARA